MFKWCDVIVGAVSVLLGLYPTVMLLTLFVSPHLQGLNLAVSMLIGNILSVCILQWLVMPVLNPVLATWMRANDAPSRDRSLAGLALIVVALGAITFLSALSVSNSGVAYVAHLGGMIFGFIYLKGGRLLPDLRYRYDRWHRNRLRRKFEVYYNERRRNDDDQEKWRRWRN